MRYGKAWKFIKRFHYWTSAARGASLSKKGHCDSNEESGIFMTNEIDIEVLKSLVEMGDEEFLNKLIRMFLKDAPLDIEKIQQSLQQGQIKEMGQAAHHLKSSTQNLGTHALTEICAQLDNMGKQGTADGAGQLVEQLIKNYQEIRVKFEEILKSGLPS
jgi:HPt (histidine-containing phosphotransfer) domain-containing protein